MGEAMYKGMNPDGAAGAADGGPSAPGGSQPDDGVVDADYEEVNDEKKKGGSR
jgi:hypothetical protein